LDAASGSEEYDMDDFMKTEVVMTPTLAGTTTTLITGTLINLFDSAIQGKWICLLVSFLFGLAFTLGYKKNITMMQRLVLLLINWLTVFTVSVGINTAGMAITQSDTRARDVPPIMRPGGDEQAGDKLFFQPWF
jgi:hypothetical protein